MNEKMWMCWIYSEVTIEVPELISKHLSMHLPAGLTVNKAMFLLFENHLMCLYGVYICFNFITDLCSEDNPDKLPIVQFYKDGKFEEIYANDVSADLLVRYMISKQQKEELWIKLLGTLVESSILE